MEKFTAAKIEYKINADSLEIDFSQFVREFLGKEIEVTLCYGVLVKNDSKNHHIKISSQKFILEQTTNILFSNVRFDEDTYRGIKIDITYFLKIRVNDSFLLKDTQGFIILEKKNCYHYNDLTIHKELQTSGGDRLNFKKMFEALPFFVKMILVIIFSFCIPWFLVIYTLIFDGYNWVQDFKVEELNIMQKIIMTVTGLAVCSSLSFIVLRGLSKTIRYRFHYKYLTNFLKDGEIKGLLSGKILFDMKNVRIIIRVSHYERGFHHRSRRVYNKKSRRYSKQNTIENFEKNVGNYGLFNEKIKLLTGGENLEHYVMGKISERAFINSVIPSIYSHKYNKRYGLFSRIEFKIISPEFSDIYKSYPLVLEDSLFYKNNYKD